MLNIVYVFLVLIALTSADYFEECEGNEGTFIAVQEDCSFFIYCDIEDSYRDSCPEDNPYFSAVEMTCDTDRKVCGDRAFPNGDFGENEDKPNALETTTFSGFATDLVTLNSTVIKLSTTIPTESSTSISSTSSLKPSSTTSPNTISTATPSVLLSCPQVDDPNRAVFVAHPKSCSEYFLCYHGQRLPMRCSHMLHFDFRQQKCDYAENVKCHVKNAISPRDQCLPNTQDVYPHPSNCNYYYKCSSGFLQVMQCPLYMGWHYEKRACMLRSQAKCYSRNSRQVLSK